MVNAGAEFVDEAVVVEASWHGSTVVPLPLGGPFHARRLTLKSSQVGNLPPAKRPRWDYTRRMNLALKLAGDASLDVLFERDAVAFEDLPAALSSICGARAGAAVPPSVDATSGSTGVPPARAEEDAGANVPSAYFVTFGLALVPVARAKALAPVAAVLPSSEAL